MKKIIYNAMMLVLFGCANINSVLAEENASFENVVEMPGYNQAQIYIGTKTWLAATAASAPEEMKVLAENAVIQSESKDTGAIIGNLVVFYRCTGGAFACEFNTSRHVNSALRVDMKDGKFRITFSNLAMLDKDALGGSKSLTKKEFDGDVHNALVELSGELRSTIEKEKAAANW